jgi:hypothetical protein
MKLIPSGNRFRPFRKTPLPCIALAIFYSGIPILAAPADAPRIALVFGNSAYTGSINALANPGNDAHDIAAKLEGNGWRVILSENANRRDMARRLTELHDLLKASPGATALFFYAGHGVQLEGKNYLLPIGEEFETPTDIKESAFLVDRVIDTFAETEVRQSVVILDACRDNPFAKKSRSIGGSRGLAVVPANETAEDGSAVIFATAPNDVAADGDGRNGMFTQALLKYIDTDLDLASLFKKVREDVKAATGGKQNPSIVTAGILSGLYLGKIGTDQVATQPVPVVAKAPAGPDTKLKVSGPIAGMNVTIDGVSAGQTPLEISIAKGSHAVSLEHPDWALWKGTVETGPGRAAEVNPKLAHSVAWQIKDLENQKGSLQLRLGAIEKPRQAWAVTGTCGWIAAGVGAAASIGGFFLGMSVRSAYDSATTADAATSARNQIQACNIFFQAGIFTGGTGVLTGLTSLVATPDRKQIERDIQGIDTKIMDLEATK